MFNDNFVSLDSQTYQSLIEELESLRKRVTDLEDTNRAEVSHQIARQKALFTVVTKIRESLDLDSIFKSTATEVRQLLNADRVAMFRFDPDSGCRWGQFVSEDVLPEYNSALAANIEDYCFGNNYAVHYQQGRIWVADDIYKLNLKTCHYEILARFQVRANLVIPLLKGKILWGLLCIHQCSSPRQWHESDIEFVRQIATHLGVALQHAELVSQLQQQSLDLAQAIARAVEREKAVSAIINKIRQSLNLNTIFTTTTQEVRQLLKADRVAIYQFNDDWSGKFVVESKGKQWKSLIEHKKYYTELHKNISKCSVKYLINSPFTDTFFQENSGGEFSRGQIFRVCNDIYNAGFSSCYVDALEQFQARAYAIIAIYQGQSLWGLLAAYQNSGVREWEETEINFLIQIGGQLGVAIQQAELLAQTEKQKEELQITLKAELRRNAENLVQDAERERALAQVIDKIRRTLDLKTIFQTATTEVRQLLNADRVAVFQFEPHTNWARGEFVSEDVVSPFTTALSARIEDFCFGLEFAQKYQVGYVLAIADVYNEVLNECYINLLSQFQIKANLVVSLMKGEELWGLLCIHQCLTPRQWQKKEIEFVQKIAIQLGVALQQAELLAQAQKRSEEQAKAAQQERALAHVIDRIRQTLDIDTIFSATTQEVRQILNCDRVVVYRFLPDWNGEFVFESMTPGWTPLVKANMTTVWLDTYLQETQGGRYRNHESLAINDVYAAELSDCHLEILEEFQIRAYLVVPVFVGDTLWGLLGAYQNTDARQWQPREISLLAQVGNQLGVALQQAKLLSQLQKAKETADAANKAKSEFLANMSHELRTPLNAILGFTQILDRDSCLTPSQQEYLQIIGRSGEHLLHLINDVLEMSKIEAGRIILNPTCFDFYRLLDSLEEMLRLKAETKGLKLIFIRTTDVPQYVKTDESKLRQVLINLLGNAIKFTEMGNVLLRVFTVENSEIVSNLQLTSSKNSEDLIIYFEVEDTGPGIANEEIDLLFQAFGQTETGRKSNEGTGLGLPISKQFVQMMGGDIRVYSVLNQGTIVRFEVKVTLAEAEAIQIEPLKKQIIGLEPAQPKYRILVAEDAIENRMVLVKLLSDFGFEVQEAENGQEAVDIALSWQPHLIWLDMRMPVMDGLEATQKIKANMSAENRPVIIALTANAFEEERSRVLEAGCDDFVSKPFQEDVIFEMMAQYLGVRYLYESTHQLSKIKVQLDVESGDYLSSLQHLSVMPQSWIEQLYEAVLCTNEKQILSLLDMIPKAYASVAKGLTYLVENFEFEKILESIEQALEKLNADN